MNLVVWQNSSVDLINRINFFVNDKSDKAGLEKPPDGIRRPALFEASVPQAQGIQNHKTGHPDRIHERQGSPVRKHQADQTEKVEMHEVEEQRTAAEDPQWPIPGPRAVCQPGE